MVSITDCTYPRNNGQVKFFSVADLLSKYQDDILTKQSPISVLTRLDAE